MKILILGHRGMLGNASHNYFNQQGFSVETISDLRWGDDKFRGKILDSDAEIIINCIGAIPQKKPNIDYYKSLNVKLPMFLEGTGKKIIHPSTDCVFKGNIASNDRYFKTDTMDAGDPYGRSKGKIDKVIINMFGNTKIIRTSIIGHELNGFHSLLDWFLGTDDNVELNGYVNYLWNGITTLQWAKVAETLINGWDTTPLLTQVGSEGMSKYELLELMGNVYKKPNKINEFEMENPINKMLVSDIKVPTIEEELIELKNFYIK